MPKEETYDYTAFEGVTLEAQEDVLGRITIHAERMKDLDTKIAAAELATKKLVNERRRISEDILPDLFDSVGMTELKTRTNLPLKKKNVLHTSVAKGRKPAAIAWLDENGHGGIVKRQVVINFNLNDNKPGEDGTASRVQRLLNLIGNGWKDHKTELDINGASVKALVKKLLEGGEEVPKETFGIHQVDVVEITS